VRRADNLTTFMCRLSTNLGASNSWNPKGLSRRVMGLLCVLIQRNLNLYSVRTGSTFFQRLFIAFLEGSQSSPFRPSGKRNT
jgi:hypothetical protein